MKMILKVKYHFYHCGDGINHQSDDVWRITRAAGHGDGKSSSDDVRAHPI